MATEETNDNEQEPAKKKKLVPVAIAIALGLLAGGGAGAFAAGSLLPKSAAGAEAKPADEKPAAEDEATDEESADDEAPADEEGAEEGEEEPSKDEAAAGDDEAKSSSKGSKTTADAATYLMENLVLNPAGTGGTRFLMVSVAFAVRDTASSDAMKARDHEVRDVLLGVLGKKTVAQLADVAVRDSIKVELKREVGGLFPKGTLKRVYFPQFVIQ